MLIKMFSVLALSLSLITLPASAALVRVDPTGITIPPGAYPVVEDLVIPEPATSPFFSFVLNGVQEGLLSRVAPGFHINADGSAMIVNSQVGQLGTFIEIFSVPVGGFGFTDISSLPPEPFQPAAFLLATNATLTSVSGPGFTSDVLVGTGDWHYKVVLTGPFMIDAGTSLTALPDDLFAAAARHFSVMGVAYHSSTAPEPGTLALLGTSLLGLLALRALSHKPRLPGA